MNKLEWVFNSILKSGKINYSSIEEECLIWGTGAYGEIAVNLFNKIDVIPLAYIDSNKKKQGKSFHGKAVMSPEEALNKYASAKVIIAMREMEAVYLRAELVNKGIWAITITEYLFNIIENLSVLEIGPLHNPFFKGENVKYLDVFDANKLYDIAKENNLPTDMVPQNIDYVCPNGDWEKIEEKFDFVYSSHLIEHQTNFIKHLHDVYRHVYYGGAYVMAIPDKRYCFDYFAPCTMIEDVLTAYYEKRKRHSFTALLRAECATHNDITRHWQGDHGEDGLVTKDRLDNVANRYFSSIHGEYIDVHEWYFTPATFIDICKGLKALDLLNFNSVEVSDTEEGSNAFYVTLWK